MFKYVMAVFASCLMLSSSIASDELPPLPEPTIDNYWLIYGQIPICFQMAINCYNCRDYYNAIKEFNQTLSNPTAAFLADDCMYYKAKSYFRLGKYVEALNALRALVDQYPFSEFAARARKEIDGFYQQIQIRPSNGG